jgi:pimeloyl-ACP methyl ester carboxylesterase
MLFMLPLKLMGKRGDIVAIKKVLGVKDLAAETIEYSRLISKNFSPYMGTVPVLSDEELRRIGGRVLLIAGEKDVLIHAKKTTERARKLLDGATVILLDGAGHGLINQKKRILPFLTEGLPDKAPGKFTPS